MEHDLGYPHYVLLAHEVGKAYRIVESVHEVVVQALLVRSEEPESLTRH